MHRRVYLMTSLRNAAGITVEDHRVGVFLICSDGMAWGYKMSLCIHFSSFEGISVV